MVAISKLKYYHKLKLTVGTQLVVGVENHSNKPKRIKNKQPINQPTT